MRSQMLLLTGYCIVRHFVLSSGEFFILFLPYFFVGLASVCRTPFSCSIHSLHWTQLQISRCQKRSGIGDSNTSVLCGRIYVCSAYIFTFAHITSVICIRLLHPLVNPPRESPSIIFLVRAEISSVSQIVINASLIASSSFVSFKSEYGFTSLTICFWRWPSRCTDLRFWIFLHGSGILIYDDEVPILRCCRQPSPWTFKYFKFVLQPRVQSVHYFELYIDESSILDETSFCEQGPVGDLILRVWLGLWVAKIAWLGSTIYFLWQSICSVYLALCIGPGSAHRRDNGGESVTKTGLKRREEIQNPTSRWTRTCRNAPRRQRTGRRRRRIDDDGDATTKGGYICWPPVDDKSDMTDVWNY